MKPPQGVLILGWIILCSTIVFLFNEQLQYQFPVQNIIAPKIAKPEYVVSGQGSKKYSRCFIILICLFEIFLSLNCVQHHTKHYTMAKPSGTNLLFHDLGCLRPQM